MVCGLHGVHGVPVTKIAKSIEEKRVEKGFEIENVLILSNRCMETTVMVRILKPQDVMINFAKVP